MLGGTSISFGGSCIMTFSTEKKNRTTQLENRFTSHSYSFLIVVVKKPRVWIVVSSPWVWWLTCTYLLLVKDLLINQRSILLHYFFQADVYSFGVLLLEMCTRQMPVPEQMSEQLKLVPNAELKNLIGACIHHNPENRPSMNVVINFLTRWRCNNVKFQIYLHFKLVCQADEQIHVKPVPQLELQQMKLKWTMLR